MGQTYALKNIKNCLNFNLKKGVFVFWKSDDLRKDRIMKSTERQQYKKDEQNSKYIVHWS